MQRRGDDDPGMADVKLVANLTMQLAYKNKDKLYILDIKPKVVTTE